MTLLKLKVRIVNWLVYFKILPNVWYPCQLKFAKLEAKRIIKALGWEEKEDEREI